MFKKQVQAPNKEPEKMGRRKEKERQQWELVKTFSSVLVINSPHINTDGKTANSYHSSQHLQVFHTLLEKNNFSYCTCWGRESLDKRSPAPCCSCALIFYIPGMISTFTVWLFYNRFDGREDKWPHEGKTTNHLTAFFFFKKNRFSLIFIYFYSAAGHRALCLTGDV